MSTLASVSICTYNRAGLLKKTLEAFCNMKVDEEITWELLVVNNASTDDTSRVVQSFLDRLPIREVPEERAGKSHAANTAVASSRGEFLLWTDDDALVSENWLSTVLGVFRRMDADLVFGKVVPWWESEQPKWFSSVTECRLACLDLGEQESLTKQSGFGVNYGFRKSVFESIGPFPVHLGPMPEKGFGGEDSILFQRAHQRECRVVYSPHAIVRHWVPNERCQKRYHRNRILASIEQDYWLLCETFASLPKWFGLPRFLFRQQLGNLWNWGGALATRRHDVAFESELKLLRFLALLRHANSANRKTRKSVQDLRNSGKRHQI